MIDLFIKKTEIAVLWFWLKKPKPEIINKTKCLTDTPGYYNTALPLPLLSSELEKVYIVLTLIEWRDLPNC